ncbi:LysR family transcriptional regulator [Trinickia terrae]|uniref:LysR family transcriptional regulator n=1 Tax=Trinickia terrae TaxID=2571161 RepID=A0A4U1HJ93_9BURK|nr:LysR family transcriptional regulator [Trinickia terrae]TKC81245.1 LysR family transcriptional regulator [Trinickia terrae]
MALYSKVLPRFATKRSKQVQEEMDLMQSIRAFTAVASVGSFTVAARHMQVGTPQVSRAIADLETHLGLRLLNRTTRSVALTAAGERYLFHCKCILDRVELAETEAAGLCAKPIGTLSLGVAPSFDRHHLAWLISGYQEHYSEVSVQVALVPRSGEMPTGQHDAVLLCDAVPQGEQLVAACLGASQSVLCASPVYLARRGVPETVNDLGGHRCLQLDTGEEAAGQWVFDGPEGPETFRFEQTPLRTDLSDVLEHAIRQGSGIGSLPVARALPALRSGTLVRVLPRYRLAARNMYVIHPPGRSGDAKTRTWVEFVKASLPARLAADQASFVSYIAESAVLSKSNTEEKIGEFNL